MKRKLKVIFAAALWAISMALSAKAHATQPNTVRGEASVLEVIRGYLPLLIGIAVAILHLHATHTAHAHDESNPVTHAGAIGAAQGMEVRRMETIVVWAKRLPVEPAVVKMETIVVTATRERPATVSSAASPQDPDQQENS